MIPRLYSLVLLCAAAALAACSPARTGVVDGTLTTNVRPGMAITANKPLEFVSGGRTWSTIKANGTTATSNASFDYALFVDPAVPPAEKFACAAFVRLEENTAWFFVPQGNNLPGQFGPATPALPASREGRIYTLHVPSENDWASDVLRENGQTPPKAWLVQRWVFSLESDVRAMAEYREPWPASFDVPQSEFMPLRDADAGRLRDFAKRARAAFSFEDTTAEFIAAPQAGRAWNTPRAAPDVPRLVGEVIYITQGGDEPRD